METIYSTDSHEVKLEKYLSGINSNLSRIASEISTLKQVASMDSMKQVEELAKITKSLELISNTLYSKF